MGRPIKKKFFGNTSSVGIVGGEGAAAVFMINTGTGYLTLPSISFPAVQIAGGTTATGAPHMMLRSVSITSDANGGSGYAVGDTLTLAGGTGTPAVVRVATISGSNTVTSVALVSLGDYTVLPNGGTTATHTASTGSGFVMNVTYAVKSVDVTNAGTGYTSTGTLTFGSASGTGAAARFTLTSTVGNAIALSAFVQGGAARTGGDIVKQESSRRYLVRTSDGLGQCRLITTSTLTAKTMNIIATDVSGSTYYVQKLTARRAVLVQKTDGGSGFEYDSYEAPKWSITAATTGTVSIANN